MLTDTTCKNAKCPADKPRKRFADAAGLYLEVQANGAKKSWFYKYRFAGKEKRLALGSYPAVSLAQARRDRDDARETLHTGTDPVAARHDAKRATLARAENTFQTVALEWWAHWKGTKTERHADYVKRRLEADVFPVIGTVPVADLTARQLKEVARRVEARGAVDIAKRAWQTCGQILAFAVGEDLIERSPSNEIKPGAFLKTRKKENYARVDAKELPTLLRRMDTYTGSPCTRLAMRLMALTFVRTGELIGARWEEFDLDAAEWRIPESRMKMRTPHIVPLSTQAVEVLKTLAELRNLSPMVFPGERDHEKPMSNNTILKALERMGYKHRMTGHGYRGVASTILHELGWRHDVIELQLAHQERNAVSAAYNHATYLAERRKMMQAWADHLDALRAGAKVLPFKAA
ncbi:MAG: integrase [Burkholderiales bacterium RIFCSPHIGHO2_12_FULL_69_20]|nr:MAG: integrase [Burkholderiales bacterium RIFCSPHIGHO2_12_FULL_69_20]